MEETSKSSQWCVDDTGEKNKHGQKSDFRIKAALVTSDTEALIMEASRVIPLDQKLRDDWDKLIQVKKEPLTKRTEVITSNCHLTLPWAKMEKGNEGCPCANDA